MSEFAVMPLEHYKNICDTIREKTGETGVIKSGDIPSKIDNMGSSTIDIDKIIDGTATHIKSNAEKILCLKCGSNSKVVVADFPNAVELGASQFQGCSTLETINAPNLEIMGDYTLYNCGNLKYAKFPKVTYLPGQSFLSCFNLLEVDFPLITQVKALTFLNCRRLTETNIDFSKITLIGESAFNGCHELKVYKLNADTIEANAFNQCRSILDVTFLKKPNSLSATAFAGCSNIIWINVPWSEGEVAGAPWGAVNATVHYDVDTITYGVFLYNEEIGNFTCNTIMDFSRWDSCGWSKELEAFGVSLIFTGMEVQASYKGMTYNVCRADGSLYYEWDTPEDIYLIEIGAGD